MLFTFVVMELLKAIEISKVAGERILLEKTTMTIEEGSRIAIMGETGSGKSTLLKIMAGLLEPSSGVVFLRGKKLENPAEQLIPGHPKIAYLSQHFELRNNYKIIDLLEMSARLNDEACKNIIELCRISHLLYRKTHEISGGERQRIALARLLIGNPELLFLDEPFSNLDMVNKSIIREVLGEINSALNLTCVMVSHHPEDVLPWADTLMIMQKGHVIQSDHPRLVYLQPINGYAASLTGYCNPILPGEESLATELGIQTNLPQWIRPENLVVHEITVPGLRGRVDSIDFFGHYMSISIQTGYRNFTVFSSQCKFKPGEEVSVTVNHQMEVN